MRLGRRARSATHCRILARIRRPLCAPTVQQQGRYKYVGFRDAPELLFDLNDDPLEQRNLSPGAEGEDAEALARLRRMVAQTMDFDAAEAERLRDEKRSGEYELKINRGVTNAYLLPDGRIVHAEATLYRPEVLTADPATVFADWPEGARD